MPSAASSWISSQKSRRAFGSTPAVGSSSSSSCGECSMHAASAKPLLPSARQRAGQLRAARGQAEAVERRVDRLLAVGNAVHPRDEVEVLLDRQVLVQAEALRHVADLALDRRRVATQVVAKARAFTFVGRQQSAQHADRRRLAAPVGPEKAEDRPALDSNREVVDDGAPAIALRQTVHVDGGAARRVRDIGCAFGCGRGMSRWCRHRARADTATSTGSPGCKAGLNAAGRASTRNTRFARFSRL